MRTHSLWCFLLLLSCGIGCTAPGNGLTRIRSDSLAVMQTRLAQAESIAVVKDSLVRDLAEATQLILAIGSEIASVQQPRDIVGPRLAGTEGAQVDDRVALIGQVRNLTTRVRRSEARLSATRRRLATLTARADSTQFALTAYAQSLADLTAIVESQKVSLATLTGQIDTLSARNAELTGANEALADTLEATTLRENTVYVVAGTRKELLSRGIIVEEGGTRFLIFTRTGETLRPAKTLDPADFDMLDLRTTTDIPLPRSDKDYQIVSGQDVAHLDPTSLVDGKIRGSLRIWDPQRFWAPSHFLILVER